MLKLQDDGYPNACTWPASFSWFYISCPIPEFCCRKSSVFADISMFLRRNPRCSCWSPLFASFCTIHCFRLKSSLCLRCYLFCLDVIRLFIPLFWWQKSTAHSNRHEFSPLYHRFCWLNPPFCRLNHNFPQFKPPFSVVQPPFCRLFSWWNHMKSPETSRKTTIFHGYPPVN